MSYFNNKKKLFNALRKHSFTNAISNRRGIDQKEIVDCIDNKFLIFVMSNEIVFYNSCDFFKMGFGETGGCYGFIIIKKFNKDTKNEIESDEFEFTQYKLNYIEPWIEDKIEKMQSKVK